jgi:transcriptional regulator with XRE-family HTH domain
MDIVKNIKEIRQQKSISQATIAGALNVDIAVVSNIENGKRELKVSELDKISNALGITTLDLLTYPKTYIEASTKVEEPIDAVLQIRLQKEKKEQVLKLIFGDNNLEILNK